MTIRNEARVGNPQPTPAVEEEDSGSSSSGESSSEEEDSSSSDDERTSSSSSNDDSSSSSSEEDSSDNDKDEPNKKRLAATSVTAMMTPAKPVTAVPETDLAVARFIDDAAVSANVVGTSSRKHDNNDNNGGKPSRKPLRKRLLGLFQGRRNKQQNQQQRSQATASMVVLPAAPTLPAGRAESGTTGATLPPIQEDSDSYSSDSDSESSSPSSDGSSNSESTSSGGSSSNSSSSNLDNDSQQTGDSSTLGPERVQAATMTSRQIDGGVSSSSDSSSSYYSSSDASSSLDETEAYSYSEADTVHSYSTRQLSVLSGWDSVHSLQTTATKPTAAVQQLGRVDEVTNDNSKHDSMAQLQVEDESDSPSFAMEDRWSNEDEDAEGLVPSDKEIEEMHRRSEKEEIVVAPIADTNAVDVSALTVTEDKEEPQEKREEKQEDETEEDPLLQQNMNVLLFRGEAAKEEQEALTVVVDEADHHLEEETFARFEILMADVRRTDRHRAVPTNQAKAQFGQVLVQIRETAKDTPNERLRGPFDQVMAQIRETTASIHHVEAKPNANLSAHFEGSFEEVLEDIRRTRRGAVRNHLATDGSRAVGSEESSDKFGRESGSEAESHDASEKEESHTEEDSVVGHEHGVDSKPSRMEHSESSTDESETGWPSEDESSSDDETQGDRSITMAARKAISLEHANFSVEPVTVASVRMPPTQPSVTENDDPEPVEDPDRGVPKDAQKPKKGFGRFRQFFAFGRLRSPKRQPVSGMTPTESGGRFPLVGAQLNDDEAMGDESSYEESSSSYDSDSSSSSRESSSSEEESAKELSVIREETREGRCGSRSNIDSSDVVARLASTSETFPRPGADKAWDETEHTWNDVTHSHSSTDDLAVTLAAPHAGTDRPAAVVVGGGIREDDTENHTSVRPGSMGSAETEDSQYTFDPVDGRILRQEQGISDLSLITTYPPSEAGGIIGDQSKELGPNHHGFFQNIKGFLAGISKKAGGFSSDAVSSDGKLNQPIEDFSERFADECMEEGDEIPIMPTVVDKEEDQGSDCEEFKDEEMGSADHHSVRGDSVAVFPSDATKPLLPTEPYKVHRGEADLPFTEQGRVDLQSREIEFGGDEPKRTNIHRTDPLRRRTFIIRLVCVLFFFVIVPVVIVSPIKIRKNKKESGLTVPLATTSPTSPPIDTEDIFARTDAPTSSASAAPSTSPTTSPSGSPTISPTAALIVPLPVLQNTSADEIWMVDFFSVTLDEPVSLYAAHLESNVTVDVILPGFDNTTLVEVYSVEESFVEIGSQCSQLMDTALLYTGNSAQMNGTSLSAFLDGTETAVVLCVDGNVSGASYHIFPPDTTTEEVYFTVTVDFTDETLEGDRTLRRGPGVALDGAALLLLLSDENTTFFSRRNWPTAMPEDQVANRKVPAAFELGDPCPKIYSGLYPSAFSVTPLLVEGPFNDTVYACDDTVIGRLFLEYIPLDGSTYDAGGGGRDDEGTVV